MKKWKLVAVAIGGAIAVALAYFYLVKPVQAQTAKLVITNPQASYSRSNDEIVLAELTSAGASPFEVQFWVNNKLFHTGTGYINLNPLKIGFWVRENAGWGFINGENSVYFVVKDAGGKVGTSNTITFMVAE